MIKTLMIIYMFGSCVGSTQITTEQECLIARAAAEKEKPTFNKPKPGILCLPMEKNLQ